MRTTLLNASRTNQRLSYFSKTALSAAILITLMFGYDTAQAQCDPNDTTGPTVICRNVNTTFHPTTCSVAIWPKEVVFNAYDDTTPREHLQIAFDPEFRRNSITLTADGGLRQTIDVYVRDLCGNVSVCRPTVDINDNTGQCVNRFDLALRKTLLNPGVFQLGDSVTFQIEVFNQGSDDAFNVEVADYIPNGLTLIDNNWSQNGSTAIINNAIAMIESGESAIVTIDFVIDENFTGTDIVNFAEISAADDDQDPTNTPPVDEDSTPDTDDSNDGAPIDDEINNTNDEDDHDLASLTVERFDLALTKVISTEINQGTFEPGSTVQFTITVFNQGSLDAYDIDVVDQAPAGLSDVTFVSSSGGVAQVSPGNFTIDFIPAGGSRSFEVSGVIDAGFMGRRLINDAEITGASDVDGGPDADDVDSTPGDDATPDDLANDNDVMDTTGGDDQDPAEIIIGQIFDLALTKVLSAGSTGPFNPGSTVQFTITVFNQGSLDAFDIDVVDSPPTGLSTPTLVAGAAGVVQNADDSFSIDDIQAGNSFSFDVEATIDVGFMGSSLINDAEIVFASEEDGGPNADDIDSVPGDDNTPDDLANDNDIMDTNGGDDQDPAEITVDQIFDLALTKVINTDVTPGPFDPGSTVRFTITVFNQGTVDAFDVDVIDDAPVALSSTTLIPMQTGVLQNANGTYMVDFVQVGSSFSFEIESTIDPDFMGRSLINDAEITGGSDVDGGPNATDVDSTPGNDATPDDLANDNDIADANGGDDQDPAEVIVEQNFDLALTKVVNTDATPGPYGQNSTVQYTITILNQGSLNAYDIDVFDDLPVGLGSQALVAGQSGVTESSTGNYTVDFLSAGSTFSFDVQATVDSDFMGTSLINDAEITGGSEVDGGPDATDVDSTPGNDATPDDLANDNDTADVNGGDDQDPAMITVGQVFDLALIKVVDTVATPGPFMPGSAVRFTITVFNQGTLDAFDIDVLDTSPSGLSVPTLVVGQTGIVQNSPGDFTIASLPVGASFEFELEAFIDADFMGGELINDAEITGASDMPGGPDVPDVDSAPGDDDTPDDISNDNDISDTTGGDDQDPAIVIVEQTFDLALRKTLSPGQDPSVSIGDTVSFDITVFNQGTIDATRVDLVEYVPAGLQIIEENGWGALNAQDESRRNDIIPSGLAPGQSTTVQARFVVIAQQAGEIINAAEIIRADNVLNIQDCDSIEDGNGTNDDLINDDIGSGCDTNNDDEDDHDIEPITVEVFDLALIKVIDTLATPGPFMPGSTVRFTITAFNQGTLDAFDIDILDSPPVGLSVPTLVGGQGGVVQNVPGDFTIATLPAGSSFSFELQAFINADFMGVQLINDAEIVGGSDMAGGSDAPDVDSTPGDNATPGDLANDNDVLDSNGGDDQDPALVMIGQVFDLALRKTLSPGQDRSVSIGDTVSFDITVFNQGSIDATRIDLVEYVPTGLQIIQENGWGALNAQDESRRNDIIPSGLAPGQSITVQARFVVTAQQAGEIINAAEIIRADNVLNIQDCDSTEDGNGTNDDLINDDIGSACDTNNDDEDDHDIEPVDVGIYDLAIMKTDDNNDPYQPGDDVPYQIMVINQGSIPSGSVTVTDYVPNGMSLSPLDNNGWVQAGVNITNTINNVGVGQTVTLDLILRIDPSFRGLNLRNWAEISSDSGNDIDSTPDGINFNQPGETNDLADDDVKDENGMEGGDEDDHDLAQIAVRFYDLSIQKSILNGQDGFELGDTVEFEITVVNEGTIDAAGIVVTDFADAGLVFLGPGNNSTNVSGTAPLFTIANLDSGDTETFTLFYEIDANFQGDVLMNIAEITADDGDDVDSDPTSDKETPDGLDSTSTGDDDGGNIGETDDDDEDMVMILIGRDFDLAIEKGIVTEGPFQLGDEVTFLITVTNEGQADAANVGITDFPDAGLIFASTNVGTNSNVSGSINDYVIADLDAGDSEQFEITYTISETFGGSQLMNIVEITADDGDDIDSDPDVRKDTDDLGDSLDDDDEDMVVIPLDRYDLSIQKEILTQGPFDLGDEVTFTITIVNEGTLDASNIIVTDFPDEDLTFVSVDLPANVTTVAGELFQFEVASLPAGATETFDITLEISEASALLEFMNVVEITADDGDDQDSNPDIRKNDGDGLDGTTTGDDDGGNVGETDDDDEDMVVVVITPEQLCPCPDEEFIGQAVVTCSGGAFGNEAVAAILDLRPANLATPGDDWANPATNGADVLNITNPATWTFEQLGQIYGTSVGNTDGNIFFGASNVYAYDGDPFTPTGIGPGGEQGIYATNFSNPASVQTLVTTSNNFIANPVGGTVVPGRFLDVNLADNGLSTGWGNIAYDELTNTIYGSNLSDGRIYAIDATTGVIRQVIDPFPAGGQGFLSDPYPVDQVVWAIELNECTRQIFFIQQNVAGGGVDLGDGGGNRMKSLYTLDIDNTNGMLSNQQLFQVINDGTREKITDIDFSTDCSRMLLGERGTVHNSGVYLYELNGAGNNFNLLTDISIGSIDGGDPWEFGLNSSGGVAFGSDEASSDAGICDTLIWAMADCLDPALVAGECNSYGPQGTFIPSGDITDLSGDLNDSGIFVDITPGFLLDPRFSKFGLGDIEVFNCCCPGIGNAASALQSGQIAGAVRGPGDRGAVNFSVTLTGEESGYDVTDGEGIYGFESLEMNRSYTVSPNKVDRMVSGVTTLDLILIQNHILGIIEIEDPRLRIAADINKSGTINALDIIELRRAILGLSYVAPTAEAWRFITADSEAMKGFGSMNYDEEYFYRSLEQSQYEADFYAIKVGDVNNTLATAKSRNSDFQTLKIKKSQSTISIKTSRDFDIKGMQMSIDLRGQQLVDITSDYVVINEGNYNVKEGILIISFDVNSSIALPANAPLLELHFDGRAGTIELSDHINAESYDSDLRPRNFILTEDFELDGYSLGQNNPNPTAGTATIDFVIPSPQTVKIHFYSLDGRLIGSSEKEYPAGRNTITVDGELIQHNTGSIIYKMITDEFVATKNMIIVR